MSATIPGGKTNNYAIGKQSDEAIAASRAKKVYTQEVGNPYAEVCSLKSADTVDALVLK